MQWIGAESWERWLWPTGWLRLTATKSIFVRFPKAPTPLPHFIISVPHLCTSFNQSLEICDGDLVSGHWEWWGPPTTNRRICHTHPVVLLPLLKEGCRADRHSGCGWTKAEQADLGPRTATLAQGVWGVGNIHTVLPPLQSLGSHQKLLQKQDKPTNNRILSFSFYVSQATPSTQQQFRVQKPPLFGQLMAGRWRDLRRAAHCLWFGNPSQAPAAMTFIPNTNTVFKCKLLCWSSETPVKEVPFYS